MDDWLHEGEYAGSVNGKDDDCETLENINILMIYMF